MEARSTAGYLLCGSPRGGSTLLCDLLAQTGVAGMPQSYFRPASIPGYSNAWGIESGIDGWGHSYIESVRDHGEAGTGCFGMRIMWSPPRYDHGLIAAELQMLDTEARGWDAWFSAQSITPLDLTYEALSRDPGEQTRAVLSRIGRESDIVPAVGTAKMATSLSDEWVARFLASRK